MKVNLKRNKFNKLLMKRLRWSSPITMTVYFIKPDDMMTLLPKLIVEMQSCIY